LCGIGANSRPHLHLRNFSHYLLALAFLSAFSRSFPLKM